MLLVNPVELVPLIAVGSPLIPALATRPLESWRTPRRLGEILHDGSRIRGRHFCPLESPCSQGLTRCCQLSELAGAVLVPGVSHF